MCSPELSELFKSCLSEFPGDKPGSVFEDFEAAMESAKYDVQDRAIIEAVLKEESDSLRRSFAESFGGWLKQNDGGKWDAEKSAKAVEIFRASLESLINYYYNSVIAGQFSGG